MGLPRRLMTISSPAMTRPGRADRCVLASNAPIVTMAADTNWI
jgi:hypothetical protein